MKWLNFIPLLAWMLGYLALCEWHYKIKAEQIDGSIEITPQEKQKDVDEARTLAVMYLIGIVFWLLVALCLCGSTD
jgi:hypothetical protein